MLVDITIGVLALQGAFHEHLKLLQVAIDEVSYDKGQTWQLTEVRTPSELARCDALIIPGGESTTVALVAARTGLLEPLRDFVKVRRKPTWGTCAGLILLAESANRTKRGGQDLIGGLDVRVNRNFFGRQTESFEAELVLPFLGTRGDERENRPFNGIFIRAPIVERFLPVLEGEQRDEMVREETVIAPAHKPEGQVAVGHTLQPVETMATLPGRSGGLREQVAAIGLSDETGDIVAIKQGNVFGTSFHPELTQDARIHVWWLKQVIDTLQVVDSNRLF